MDKKLLFFDIDGTLCSRDREKFIPSSTIEAVRAARQAGHMCFVNTGRVFCNVGRDIRNIGFDGYGCGCGSTIILNNQIIFHRELSHVDSVKVAQGIPRYGAVAFYESHGGMYYDPQFLNLDDYQDTYHFFDAQGTVVGNTQDKDFIMDKFFGWYNADTDLNGLQQFLSPWFEFMLVGKTHYEVQPKGCSKATGIAYLQEYFGAAKENIYAFGDGANDLSMLQACHNSICICDPEEERIKQYVTFVTKKLKDGGIAHAMRHFGII